ncbi:MAG: acyl-CoA thioesterase [Phycisphaerales bacterium]|jgi:acyl-CoA thioester hydrolase
MDKLCIEPIKEAVTLEGIPHSTPFQCAITVQPHQTSNEVNHVNNIEYLRWIDKASQLHCDACGWTREKLLQKNVMWFVARHEIDYRAEATSKDDLLLTTWVDDIKRVKSWRTTQIHAINNGTQDANSTHRLLCQCKTLWVLVDLQTRRPTSISNEMGNALQPLQKPRLAHT